MGDLAATETFKQKKQDLVEEGFDPGRISDPLYFSNPSSGAYVRLDGALFGAIIAGQVRL